MKFSEAWLRQWVNPSISTTELSAQLTMAGLEVDAIESVAGDFNSIVVGEVLSVKPHPDADKLRVCEVNIGGKENLSIVCGAKNVATGMKVPTALIGAQLPDGLQIKKSKLRGVESHGMLCSAKELGLAEVSDGLLPLPADAENGKDVREVLQLNDVSITLGLTPNRGDCLSVAGVAREVAVRNKLPCKAVEIPTVKATHNEQRQVSIAVANACPRYCGRVIRNINPHAITPLWMQERLRRSGLRSLGPIVDVTNYVLLELGQPMHAFDLDKLSGHIQVRLSKPGESLALLNDETVELLPDTVVIADDRHPIALAGIMGGADTAVGSTTQSIFLESAHFSPAVLAGKARQYGLHTDSSHRFERGVSAELPRQAMERATALIQTIAGGEVGPIVEACEASLLPIREPISLRQARIQRVLGSSLPAKQTEEILLLLGMNVEAVTGGWTVVAPAYRFDITIEEDLIEEIARITGYNNLPVRPLQAPLAMINTPEANINVRRLKQQLTALGYQEAITYSFIDPQLQQLLDPEQPAVALANPLAADMAVMRTNLWPGLIKVLQHNLNRQQNRLMLFECGLRYLSQQPDFNQVMMLSGIVCGATTPPQWGIPNRAFDFYDVKGHLEAVFGLTGNPKDFQFMEGSHPALHPGKTARIVRNECNLGWIGVMHPGVAASLELTQEVIMFELELSGVLQAHIPKYREVSRYPAISRDIAVVVDKQITAQALQDCVFKAAPEHLQNVELFDVYTGEGIDSGRKSVAMGLTLQDLSRTLTDSEVEDVIQRIVGRLQADLGASLRQ